MARRRLPPLKALPAFEQAARLLSFSAAARELHVTHGAISRQMKSLEAHLGVQLFRRSTRQLELTEAGSALLPAVRTALDIVEGSAVRLTGAAQRGPLVVACLPTFMMRWLIPRLYDFNARHPAIDVRLSASSGPVDFSREEIDVAIRIGNPPWPAGIEARPFMDEEIGPVCSPDFAARHLLRRPGDLRQLPLLHTETRIDAWSDWLRRRRVPGVDAGRGRRFEHFYFLLEAAVGGLGVAMAPRPLVEDDLRLGRLVAPLGFTPSGRRYCLIYPSSLAKTDKVRMFRNWTVRSARPASRTT